MCKVVHCKKAKHGSFVYIGRPSKWGNPFIVGIHGDRELVIDLHKTWINKPKQRWLMDCIHELRRKDLGCWCSPKTCHGDTLLKLANK